MWPQGRAPRGEETIVDTWRIRKGGMPFPFATWVTAPDRNVEVLASGGMRVSPAHVIVIQTLQRSERSEQVAAAS
jgi:hypothetical protein